MNKQMEKLVSDFVEQSVDCIVKLVRPLADLLVKTSDALGVWLSLNKRHLIVAYYGKGRVRHLALHAKKKRVRKKNIKRILTDFYER